MKIRTDFVTNSSSSSYIIARKKELSQIQKDKIVDYVTRFFLSGEEEVTSEAALEKAKEENSWIWENNEEKAKQALSEGKTIYAGWVSFEDDMPEYTIRDLYQDIWNIMAEDGDLTIIGGDLDY